eukprot:9993242-Prorocentrum_lima.AAC.1
MVHWIGVQETLITMPKWVDNMGLPKRPWSVSKGRPRKPLLAFRGHAPLTCRWKALTQFTKGMMLLLH